MARRIEIVSVESGAKAIAELLEEHAPKTCEAMWKCLETPMVTQGIHAMWVGRELMFVMPEENQRVDQRSFHLRMPPLIPYPVIYVSSTILPGRSVIRSMYLRGRHRYGTSSSFTGLMPS